LRRVRPRNNTNSAAPLNPLDPRIRITEPKFCDSLTIGSASAAAGGGVGNRRLTIGRYLTLSGKVVPARFQRFDELIDELTESARVGLGCDLITNQLPVFFLHFDFFLIVHAVKKARQLPNWVGHRATFKELIFQLFIGEP
jgi:hypothetical protein